MPGKAILKQSIKKNAVAGMKKLGTYKPEFEPIIDIYSEIREQYELYTRQLKSKEYKCDEYTAAGGTKKSALISTIETLRKDILAYSDRLCLNPKSIETVTVDSPKKSKLAGMLDKIE